MKENVISLFGQTLNELSALVEEYGQPPYRAKQIAEWLYKKHVRDPADMTNLPADFRDELSSSSNVGLELARSRSFVEASDGTKKYLFPAGEGRAVESAVIPDGDRMTLCLSTQVGCRRACAFCMTGRQKWKADLTAAEILNQYESLPERNRITNIVYMGMGEPFDNAEAVFKSLDIFTAEWGYAMSPYRLTVSTIGILPAIERYIADCRSHLAISLHSADPETRARLAPTEKTYPIRDIVALLRRHDFGLQRRLTFEIVLFDGVNDRPADAQKVARLLRDMNCRINLLRYHTLPSPKHRPSTVEAVEVYQQTLKAAGFTVTLRKSKGEDIAAACGMLSTEKNA